MKNTATVIARKNAAGELIERIADDRVLQEILQTAGYGVV